MGELTAIAWTDATFNPWWGCTRVSPGCENCYAEKWAKRTGLGWGPTAERRMMSDAYWRAPLKWNLAAEKAGVRRRVFCASMADVFEDRRDLDDQRARLWDLIEATPWLDWQLLTKRPENMVRLAPARWVQGWPVNVWAGCTAEDQQRADQRIPHLLRVPAAVRFVSAEPLLGPVDLTGGLYSCDGDCSQPAHPIEPTLDWVICGGESGPGARACQVEWLRTILRDCAAAGVPAFCKQLGTVPVMDEAAWRALHPTPLLGARNHKRAPEGMVPLALGDAKGGDMESWPEALKDLRVREFPVVRLPDLKPLGEVPRG